MVKKTSTGTGRPKVAYPKKGLTVMLDPRYIEHLKNAAADNDLEIQDLIRKALYEYIPNPFKPKAGGSADAFKVKAPKH